MNARSLQEDLLSIPGVEGAEVEGSADRPAGLRIRIAEGADQRAVGGAIRRVLTSHGLGTDTRLPGESTADADEAAAPEPAVAGVPAMDDDRATETETAVEAGTAVAVADEGEREVIDLTTPSILRGDDEALDDDVTEDRTRVGSQGDVSAPESPARAVSDDRQDDAVVAQGTDDVDDVARAGEPARAGAVSDEPVGHTPARSDQEPPSVDDAASHGAPTTTDVSTGVARLASVSVEEGRGGIVVTVTASDGSHLRQAAASTEGGVEVAVVRATAQLAMPHAPEPSVIEIEDRRVEGVDIVMIVLDVDGRKAAGSAVVVAGRAFALARATWSALSM